MTMSTAAFLCLIALHFVFLIDAFVPFPSLLSVRKLPSSTRYGAPVCTTSSGTKIDGDVEGKTSLALGVFIQHTDRCTSPPALPPFSPTSCLTPYDSLELHFPCKRWHGVPLQLFTLPEPGALFTVGAACDRAARQFQVQGFGQTGS